MIIHPCLGGQEREKGKTGGRLKEQKAKGKDVYLVNNLVKSRAKSRIGHIPFAQVIFPCEEVSYFLIGTIIPIYIITANAISQRIHQTCLSNPSLCLHVSYLPPSILTMTKERKT